MTRYAAGLAAGLALLVVLLEGGPGATAEESEFVGDSTCIACHEAREKGFTKRFEAGAHARAHENSGLPEGQTCESCHGSGLIHFETNGEELGDLLNFRTAPVAEGNAVCLECHDDVREDWPTNVHGSEELSCTSCHTLMNAESESGHLSAATQAETCASCHAPDELPKDYHQRTGGVDQLECTTCHPAHGPHETSPDVPIETETCISCHDTISPGFSDRHSGTAHAKDHPRAKDLRCESCHGSGASHVADAGRSGGEDLITFDDVDDVEAANAVCQDCHGGEDWEGWEYSIHAEEEVACSDCHTLMERVSETGHLAGATEAETCDTCHTIGDLPREFHQRVGNEGQVACSSCHLPHGYVPDAELIASPGFVGDAACIECHEVLEPGFASKYDHTMHARVLNEVNAPDAASENGCESCHGAGEGHVRAGGGRGVGGLVPFHLETPEAITASNGSCLECHQGGDRAYWAAGEHDAGNVACTSCHAVMAPISEKNLLRAKTEVETCSTCHQIQHSRIYRNAHMPLRPGDFQVSTASDGKMTCSSCHQPHGSVTESLIAHISVNDQCLSCHAEKRGPFLWEHSPVQENCLDCHDPHGGTRRAMLKMNVNRLCQSCHSAVGHPTDPAEPNSRFVVGTACLQCHTQIHGSNHPSGFALTR